jgi:hypothetical protein
MLHLKPLTNKIFSVCKRSIAKGANPILITPVMRRKFDNNGKLIDTHGEYPAVVKAVAGSNESAFDRPSSIQQ